jgi:rootletin
MSNKIMCCIISDKRGIDGRLASAQTALMLQEETIRRNERERKSMADKISSLERTVAGKESEQRQTQV